MDTRASRLARQAQEKGKTHEHQPPHYRDRHRSIGRRAKTDAVDARMLAIMAAAVEDLRPTQARSEGQHDLAELQ